MKATRTMSACLLAFSISATSWPHGQPVVVAQLTESDCRAQKQFSFEVCMKLAGLMPHGDGTYKSPIPDCLHQACLAIASPKLETMTPSVDGETVSIPYRNRVDLVPPSSKDSDWKIDAASYMNLVNLQRLVHARVQANLPPNHCEVDNQVASQSESISGDTYVYQAEIRSSFRACANAPCFPEVWKTCVAKTDLGTTSSELTVKIRFFVEGSKLKVLVDSSFNPGSMPDTLRALFNLESLFNFATGHIFRSGNQRKYQEAIENAITAAVAQSGEKISQRLTVPGGQAFKFSVEGVSLRMQSNQLMLDLKASGMVPVTLICEVQSELLKQFNVPCHRGR